MRIYVNQTGIFGSSSKYALNSDAPVDRIKPIKPTSKDTTSVAREAQKTYVAENTPPCIIDISSQGRVAVNSLKNLSDIFDNHRTKLAESAEKSRLNSDTEDKSENSSFTVKEGSVSDIRSNMAADNSTAAVSDNSSETVEQEESSSSVNTQNLTRYTEYQLRKMVDNGSITRNEMNKELDKRVSETERNTQPVSPIVRNAIAAYNYQMSYGINSVMLQS